MVQEGKERKDERPGIRSREGEREVVVVVVVVVVVEEVVE